MFQGSAGRGEGLATWTWLQCGAACLALRETDIVQREPLLTPGATAQHELPSCDARPFRRVTVSHSEPLERMLVFGRAAHRLSAAARRGILPLQAVHRAAL